MSDLVERLRRGEPCREGCGGPCRTMDAASGCICAEASDRIERLEAALEGAAVQFANNNLPAFSHQCRAALKRK